MRKIGKNYVLRLLLGCLGIEMGNRKKVEIEDIFCFFITIFLILTKSRGKIGDYSL